MKERTTSWHTSAPWYTALTGTSGQFFHKTVIFPTIIKWVPKNPRVIDFGCGSGIATRFIHAQAYTGYDSAQALIAYAKKNNHQKSNTYRIGDVTKPLQDLEKGLYSCALSILSLQNMENGEGCVQNASYALEKGGVYIVVLNHPCFRIPRQTAWEGDEKNHSMYRRVNCYKSPLSIPIKTHPGKKRGPLTWSFHHPLEDYFTWLHNTGFAVTRLAELVSPKTSEGSRSHEENRIRNEFPLFLALCAVKL